MTIWKKENGVWVEQNPKQSISNVQFDTEASEVIKATIEPPLPLKPSNAPTDYILRFFMPKQYNENNYKVNPSQIADIIFSLAEQFGGATIVNAKGYWSDKGLLYEDNNLSVDILLPQTSPEKAVLIGEYISSAIGKAFKQLSVLFMIIPTMSEFISNEQYDEKMKLAKDSLQFMQDNEQKEE